MESKRFVITVVGKDTIGIIAKISGYLAAQQVNVLDISQTIVGGYFNMMMIVDASKVENVTRMSEELTALGKEIGMIIRCQHEDIFNVMHRI